MLVVFFDWQGVIHKEFITEGETINAVYYKGAIRCVRPGMCEYGDWFLLQDNAPSHNATIVKHFLVQRKVTVLEHSPYSPDSAPADYLLFPKVKSHMKGHLFDSISGIQKLHDRTNLCLQLEGRYAEK
jgi:transposase